MKTPRIPCSRSMVRLAVLAAALVTAPALTAQVPHLLHHQGRVAAGGVNFNGTGQFKFALVDPGSNLSRTATATATVAGVGGFVTGVSVTDGGAGYTTVPSASINDKFGSGAVLRCSIAGGALTSITVLDAGTGYSAAAKVRIDAPPANIVYQTYWRNADDTSPADGEPDTAVSLAVTNGLFDVLLGNTALPNMAALPAAVFSNPDVRLRVWFNDASHGFQQLSPDKRIAAVGYAVIAENVSDGAISSAKIAAGAVTRNHIGDGEIVTSKIATGAIGSGQLAAAAVTGDKIANSTITAAQLAKPPQAGVVPESALRYVFSHAQVPVTFSAAFATTPIVTIGQRASETLSWQPMVRLDPVATGGFTGKIDLPVVASPIASGPNVSTTKLLVSNLKPVALWRDTTTDALMCSQALDSLGKGWGTPVMVANSANIGNSNAESVGSRIGIAYFDRTSGDLCYMRSNNSVASTWTSPITLDATTAGGSVHSIAMVNGFPAIAYYESTADDLRYIRASDALGDGAWGNFVTIAATGDVGSYASLAVVAGNPAVAFYDATNRTLKYARATNAQGSLWANAINVTTDTYVGEYARMVVAGGNPAIAYRRSSLTDISTAAYVRATDATGSAWGTPVLMSDGYSNNGRLVNLVIAHGKPVLTYHFGAASQWHLCASVDAEGSGWVSEMLGEDKFGSVVLGVVSGNATLLAKDYDLDHLELLRPSDLPYGFAVNWIALEP